VLAGGGWYVDSGRWVNHGYRSLLGGRPHQQILVTVARAMGLDVEHIGLASLQVPGGELDLRGDFEGFRR
jgi:hypothetical protein